MERTEWLKKMRAQSEALYDFCAPAYWVRYGFSPNGMHCRFIEKFLGRLRPQSTLLDAACGAGRYDEMLLKGGHTVLGIDQSEKILARAREHYPEEQFPRLRYEKTGLQEMGFEDEFDGAICMDAMENIPPEEWLEVLARFHRALKPGGVLYLTVEVPDWDEIQDSYERSRAMDLPVVFGEFVDKTAWAYEQFLAQGWETIPDEVAGVAVYHYYPSMQQVRSWFGQAGLAIEEEGSEADYAHFLARKKA